MQSSWVDRVLDFAIVKEERAADFYRYLANEARAVHMQEVFLGFAGEEEEHKSKLLDIKAGKLEMASDEQVADLGLAEMLEDEPIDLAGNMDYRQALLIAMKSEQEAYRLYSSLAAATGNAECKAVLLKLAEEEARHKLRFELEYDQLTL